MTKQNKTLKIILLLAIVIVSALAVPSAEAYILYCLKDGESVPPACTGSDCRYTCDLSSGSGFCQICTTDLGNPGVNPSRCFSETCTLIGGDSNATDINPPNATINSPTEGATYDSKRVLFDIDVDSRVRIEYRTPEDTSWHKLCDGCRNYFRNVNLKEGDNEVTIRVLKKSNSQSVEYTINFNIDSKVPDFRKAWPKNGEFANGEFIVEYSEENLDHINLNYKVLGDPNWSVLPLSSCPSGINVQCNTNMDLSPYDGSVLEYFFEICDTTNCDTSPEYSVKVDSTPPVIVSFTNNTEGRHKTFTFEINEPFFEKVQYRDNSDTNPRWRILCTRLSNNICSKKVPFKDGQHEVEFEIIDEAGNFVSTTSSFFIDSRLPRIIKTEPRRGFASGNFYLEFQEANPQSLDLHFGNQQSGFQIQSLDLSSDCFTDRNKQKCDIQAPLNLYDGQEIEYYFNLTDIVGQSTIPKPVSLKVDTSYPIINSIISEVDRSRVTLTLDVTEENFDEATYIVNTDSRPRERRFCSRLSLLDSTCDKRISLRDPGLHNITISVFDKAGNAVAQNVEVNIV
jgi:hypothetical protein